MAFARYKEPQFIKSLLKNQREAIIEQASLGRENTEIAKLYLIDRVPQIDIAAELGCERSTISRRMPGIIVQLEETARKMNFT